MLAAVPLLSVLDSIASGVDLFEVALGVIGDEENTIAGAAAGNRDALAALNDSDVQEDLTPVFARRAALVKAGTMYALLQGSMVQRALDRHYGSVGGLNRFLTSEDARVHPNLRKIGMQIDAINTFASVAVDPVAQYEGTGVGTGAFVAGSLIDASKYFAATLELVVDAMGDSDREVRLTLTKYDGTAVTRDVVVPADAAEDSALPIGASDDMFVGVTGIVTINGGGTALDRLRVRSVVERAIAL